MGRRAVRGPDRPSDIAIAIRSERSCPIEPLDVGILLWLARLDIFELYAPCAGPLNDRRTQVLRAVIAPNR